MTKPAASSPLDGSQKFPFDDLLKGYETKPFESAKTSAFHDFSKEAYKEGLLAKVLEKAGDAILNSAEVKQLLMGAISEQMWQDLEGVKLPLNALVTAIAEEGLILNIPAMGGGVGLSTLLLFAPLLAESAVSTVMKTLQPEFPMTTLKQQTGAENLLKSLIGLSIQTTPQSNVQIAIPNLRAATPATVMQQLVQAKAEFAMLFEVAKRDGLNTSLIASFKDMPEQAIMLLQQNPDRGRVMAILGVWVANRAVVQAALFKEPYNELRARLDKVRANYTPEDKEDEKKLLQIDELLAYPPILANYLLLKELLNDLEEKAEKQSEKAQSITARLLFAAASEIRQIASGKKSAEYQYVGLLHTQLEKLSKKIDEMLPEKLDQLTSTTVQTLGHALYEHLGQIKSENPKAFTMVLKSHPRTLLYLLFTRSSLLEDVSIPYAPDIATLEELFQKQALHREFYRYQPEVLRRFLEEAKKEKTTELAKAHLRVVQKAIKDMAAAIT